MNTVAVPSKLDTHHDMVKIREAIERDRWPLMREFSRHHSVLCDCASDTRISEENCAGLQVLNHQGKQVASYRGQQYRALRRTDGTIAIFSTLVRN
jgi:hypothetical protein